MSSFSSLSSLRALPSPAPSTKDRHRTDLGVGSRPRSGTNASHVFRHPHAPSSAGRRARWEEDDALASLPCSSNPRDFVPRYPIGDRVGHASPPFAAQTPPPKSKVRRYSRASSSGNEVSPVFRVGGLGHPTPGIQAHQFEHAPNGRTTRIQPLVFAQVAPGSLNEPPSLSSSLTSPAPSLTTPPTPQSPIRSRRRSVFVTPSTSVSSLRSQTRPCEAGPSQCESHTPCPSPLSHASRARQSPSSHQSPPSPHTFSIKCGLVPLRARPTLAMSMQVHAPTPVLSTRPMSPSLPPSTRPRSRSRQGSTSRPSSPLTSTIPLPSSRPPMARPPSRSERLLRDTLRRAEEQERLMNPTPSLFGPSPPMPNANLPPSVVNMFGPCRLPAASHGGRRHRRNTSASMQSDSSCDYFDGEVVDEESQEDEDQWLWRDTGAASSSEHGYGQAYHPSRTATGSRVEGVPYGTPASPSPARAQLHRAAKSSPSVPRRHSHSHSISHLPAHPPPRASAEVDHSLTPHETVLRSKLEGVLKGVKASGRRTGSIERRDPDSGFSSGSGNSMASSRNLSGEGDFFFGANGDQSSLTSLTSNDLKHRLVLSSPSSPRQHVQALQMAPHPRPTHRPMSSHRGSTSSSGSPLTPPPSPPFNARQAAAQCKAMDGYISFATIEGLGVPEGSDEDEDEQAKSRSRWFQWLQRSDKAASNNRARGRSESSSSASR